MDYQKILEEVKNKVDIVDLISEYINLNKTGQNYRALCPFHAEKTPSFFISPSKQIFHCFGCGKGGDVVSFLMEYEKISFNEALSILASKAGIELQLQTQSSVPKDKIYKIYEIASKFYSIKLKESDKAQKYLKNRGIERESIEVFKIGYAPSEKNSLYEYLKKEGFDERLIRISRLVNNFSDFFQDRIIIPITDLTGKTIAFGGRSIDSHSDVPKYINSPDSPIFKKGDTIFGLFQAKQHIKEKGYAILMEGYLDVILSHQYGFMNAIAPLGTALTSEQLNKIKRFTNKMLLIFDGDEAGIKATDRSLSPLFQAGFMVKIVSLPKGHDPASILQKYGDKQFKSYISKALTPVEFYLHILNKKTLNERVYEILTKISHIRNLIYRDELIKELSEKTSMNELTLREELKNIIQNRKKEGIWARKENARLLNEEEIILRICLSFPDKLAFIFEEVPVEMFGNPVLREIYSRLKEKFKEDSFSIGSFLNNLTEEQKALISKLIITSEISEDSMIQSLTDCIKKIKIKFIDKKIKEIGKSGDEKYLQRLIKEKNEILRY